MVIGVLRCRLDALKRKKTTGKRKEERRDLTEEESRWAKLSKGRILEHNPFFAFVLSGYPDESFFRKGRAKRKRKEKKERLRLLPVFSIPTILLCRFVFSYFCSFAAFINDRWDGWMNGCFGCMWSSSLGGWLWLWFLISLFPFSNFFISFFLYYSLLFFLYWEGRRDVYGGGVDYWPCRLAE